MLTVPPDATHREELDYYKIGAHGFLYFWNGEQWIDSIRQPQDIEKMKPIARSER